MAVLQITLSWVASRDHRLMVRVNHWRPPRWMRLWMLAATRGGDGGLWYALGLAVALYGGPNAFTPSWRPLWPWRRGSLCFWS